MSKNYNLLSSLRSSSSRQTDEHGVAELLEAVSRRTMSCTEEEKQEIGDMVKRVREHHHKPNPVELLQKKLSGISMTATGTNNKNNGQSNPDGGGDVATPKQVQKPKFTTTTSASGIQSIGNPLNNLGKDIVRGFSKLQNQLSQSNILSPLTDRMEARQRPTSPPQQQKQQQPNLLRDFGPEPTIAVLPPIDDDVSKTSIHKQEEYQKEQDGMAMVVKKENGNDDEVDEGDVSSCHSVPSNHLAVEPEEDGKHNIDGEGAEEALGAEEKKQDP
ncbi:hypothetical protein IV203_010049 [Nitzschia inconspicua]|uniref:Uncharacterized protein n=1 Tax=Nitzschia inconspicua TaxID=303405 RepID=A0A9K3KVD4_9STRA|nr:hypothetical protein IV203_010049 [Nitzschia inconspicua]